MLSVKWCDKVARAPARCSLRSRRKRGRGRGARTWEKNGGLGARDEGSPATKPG